MGYWNIPLSVNSLMIPYITKYMPLNDYCAFVTAPIGWRVCLLLRPLGEGFSVVPNIVIRFSVSLLYSKAINLLVKTYMSLFFYLPYDYLQSVSLPYGTIGWSAVCVCGISWQYLLKYQLCATEMSIKYCQSIGRYRAYATNDKCSKIIWASA